MVQSRFNYCLLIWRLLAKSKKNCSPTHDNSTAWIENYGQGHFNSLIFSKRPLLAITSNNIGIATPSNISYFKSYKTAVKTMLLKLHNE